ncbi:hypothetical protein TELCIR_19560, partial [Teladorsagia circumcincta]
MYIYERLAYCNIHRDINIKQSERNASFPPFRLEMVYYVVCDATVTKFTKYPVTVTSSSRDDMVKVTGKCVANAAPAQSEAPTGFCTSTGRWNHLIGECGCKPGFTSDSFNGEDKCI